MKNHAYWTEYLKSARNGHDRPINGTRSQRVMHGYNGDIILRLHYTNVVTLHADGTETINTGGWNTVTTRKFITEHSRARVWSDRYQLVVRTAEPTFTPPRVSKCRRCKGGQCKQECYGPGWCYQGRQGYSYEWGSRPDEPCEHGKIDAHRLPLCSHGETAAHALPSVDCWQCHGVGRFDYGSNPVHYQWDGGPLTIDSDGYPVGPVVARPIRHVTPIDTYLDRPVRQVVAERPALSPLVTASAYDGSVYNYESYPEPETLGKYASDGRYAEFLADIDSLIES